MNVRLKIQQFVVASFQASAQGLKQLPVPAGQASLCQPGARRIFHPKPRSGGFMESNWEPLSPLDGLREEMCRAVLLWSAGPVLEGWNSLFTRDIAWGSLKPFLTSTFLFYPNYPGFVVYQQPAWAVCQWDWRFAFSVPLDKYPFLVPSGISISCSCPAPHCGCRAVLQLPELGKGG